MGDYLSNLVTRHLGKEAAIQPRLASRFEPPRAAGGLAPARPLGLEEIADGDQAIGEPSPGVLPARRLTTPQPAVDEPGVTPAPLPGQSGDRTSAARPQLAPPADEQSSQPIPPTLRPARTSRPSPLTDVSSVQPPDRAEQGGPATQPAHFASLRSVRSPDRTEVLDHVEVHPPALVLPQVAASLNPNPNRQAEPIQPAIPPNLIARITAPVRPLVATIGRANRIAQPQKTIQAPVEPPETPEHVIHVTIGRIEVRAAPPAAPAPRQRSTAPVMSLDDYLKRRNGRER